MSCWICEKDILETPKTEFIKVHWKCLESLRMELDHLDEVIKEER